MRVFGVGVVLAMVWDGVERGKGFAGCAYSEHTRASAEVAPGGHRGTADRGGQTTLARTATTNAGVGFRRWKKQGMQLQCDDRNFAFDSVLRE